MPENGEFPSGAPTSDACEAFAKRVDSFLRRLHIHVMPGGEERAKKIREAVRKIGWEENASPNEHVLLIVGRNINEEQIAKLRDKYKPCAVAVWGGIADKAALCYLVGTVKIPMESILSALEILRAEAGLIKSLAEERTKSSEALTYLEQLITTRDEFFSIATHDIRSPLTTLKLSLSMLKNTAENEEILSIMQRNIARMEVLVNDMLEVFRLYRGAFTLNLSATDVNRLVEDNVVSFYPHAIEKDITLDFAIDRKVELVRADPFRVSQVIANLVSNGLKYTPRGGIVEVATRWEKTGILVSIKDNGPGIPMQERDKLFKSFGKGSAATTGGEQSTGLGLYICKRIMDMHKGKIWFESEPGAGATFHVLFPIDPTAVTNVQAETSGGKAIKGGC